MPARIRVSLVADSAGTVPPPQTGPAVAAAFLNALSQVDPELATRIHDGPRPKPYALTPLLDETDSPPVRTSKSVRFEVGVLADEIFATVLEALMSERPWRIGRTVYRRAGTDVTALATYPDLAAAAAPSSSWAFRLVTPTGFGTAREEGVRRQRVLPQPEWVFRSLYTRWHGLAGGTTAPLPPSLPAAVEEHFEVSDCTLRVADHLVKAGAPPVRGCVGTVRFALAQPRLVPDEARQAVDVLARFAAYSGLGDRTTVGMGFAVPVPNPGSGTGTGPNPVT